MPAGLLLVTAPRSTDLFVGGRCGRRLFVLMLHLYIFTMLLSLADALPLLFASLADDLPQLSPWRKLCCHRLSWADAWPPIGRLMDGCFTVMLCLMSYLFWVDALPLRLYLGRLVILVDNHGDDVSV
jgi:hypothetical protein